MTEIALSEVRDRLARIQERIDAVERPFSQRVEIMFVTKGFGPDAIDVAAALGATSIGENYAQELRTKTGVLDELRSSGTRPEVAFIGRLQSNKVRLVADVVDVWGSVDRRSLIDEIAKRAPGSRVMVQVNTTGEAGKGGCPPGEVAGVVDAARDAGLVVDGLLTVGPTDGPPEAARPGFERVRSLADALGLRECSMGMSGDLEVAVASGSTQVRLGTALFGARP